MTNSIAFARNYTAVIDEVYQRAAVSGCLNSLRRMARAGRNAKEIMIPKIEVTGLGGYARNVGYKTGSITYEFETKAFNHDRGIRLLADVMDVDEAGVLDSFVETAKLCSSFLRTAMFRFLYAPQPFNGGSEWKGMLGRSARRSTSSNIPTDSRMSLHWSWTTSVSR